MKSRVVVYASLSLFVALIVLVPRAHCQIDQYQYFGSEIPMDDLDNISIGAASSQLNAQALDFRFTALQTGSIVSMQGYMMTNPNVNGKTCDYACGTGGTIVVQVLADDGTGHPYSPSQKQPLGTASLANPVGANVFYTFTFSPAIAVTAGTIYHLVWTDPTASGKEGDTSSSFISIETIHTEGSETLPLTITKDQLGTVELPTGTTWADSNWSELTPSSSGKNYYPIASLVYQNGGSQGLGYYQIGESTYTRHVGGTDAIREVITMPSNNVTVDGAAVRLALSSGSAELHVHLETATGATIDDCYIPASSFSSSPQYASCNFGTSHTLLAGQTYHIDFESDSGTVYLANPMENGAKGTPAYGTGTTFPYGHAEYETSGTWEIADGNGGTCTCWDWQFYFNVD